MSPRLLRPVQRGGNFATDAAARSYIEAVRIADGGQYMEPAVQRAIDAFIIGLKADSIFTPIKAACVLMGARTLAGALTPLVGGAPTNVNNNFVSGDYDRETGLLGDGVGKYLDSNRNSSADPQNSYHQAVYVTTAPTVSSGYIGAGAAGTGSSQIDYVTGGSGTLGWRNRTGTGITQASIGSPTGLIATSRAASGSYTSRVSGTNSTRTSASQTPHNGNVLVFARNSATNVAGLFLDGRMSFYSIGESVDLALLDTRVTTLYNAIAAAI
jgi:hypothetical protein